MAPDLWKALSECPGALQVLLHLLNQCWNSKRIPTSWARATIATLFKKGDESLPQNYRPISLLTVGYKTLAAMLHYRLVQGGCEGRLRDSQFGFRKHRSTVDAIFLAQRLIDHTRQGRDTKLSIIRLDWSRAFDCVRSTTLLQALARFGIPGSMIEMTAGITVIAVSSFVTSALPPMSCRKVQALHRAAL